MERGRMTGRHRRRNRRDRHRDGQKEREKQGGKTSTEDNAPPHTTIASKLQIVVTAFQFQFDVCRILSFPMPNPD